MQEQSKKFNKKRIIKKILQLKNTRTELTISVESFKSRLCHTAERISDLEDI